MHRQDFEQLVSPLFSLLRLPHDRKASSYPGYTIRIDGMLPVDLIGLQPGFINLRSVVGTLPATYDHGMLLRMLYANQFAFEHPPVSIGIDPDNAAVVVWSRQALSELGGDIQCRWFERFVKIASAVRQWLDSAHRQGPAPHSPRGRGEKTGRRHAPAGNSSTGAKP